MVEKLPIFILAGSDQKGGPIPVNMSEEDMLRGYKGAILLPNGKALAQELIDRIRASSVFGDIYLVGPARIYRSLVDCKVIDVEGKLPEVFETLRLAMYEECDSTSHIAICACDILPTSDEFQRLVKTSFAPHRSAKMWWQLIRADEKAMGASDWKQAYRLLPNSGAQHCIPYYPGHLVILQPDAMRLRLTNQLLALSYKYRNRVIRRRFLPMAVEGGWELLKQDLIGLFSWKLPRLTWIVFSQCLLGLRSYRRGRMSISEFESRLGKLFVHRQHHGVKPAVVSETSFVSFAKDFDSHVELNELIQHLHSADDGHSGGNPP